MVWSSKRVSIEPAQTTISSAFPAWRCRGMCQCVMRGMRPMLRKRGAAGGGVAGGGGGRNGAGGTSAELRDGARLRSRGVGGVAAATGEGRGAALQRAEGLYESSGNAGQGEAGRDRGDPAVYDARAVDSGIA